MLANKICKTHICIFGFCSFPTTSFSPGFIVPRIRLLYQYAVQNRFILFCSSRLFFQLQQNPVLLCFQNFQRFNTEYRRYQYFKKYFVDGVGCFFINFAIGYKYTPKSTFRITGQCRIPTFFYSIPRCYTANIGMLDDTKNLLGSFKFFDQCYGSIYINQVVIGKCFSI